MAAFTSSQSGNWNSSSTWGGSGIPASGDTATIANGHTVTIPSGYTAVIGTSPTNNSGAVALQTTGGDGGSGTGILVVNGTLQWQGPVRQGNATWTVGAGGTITYDASGATTPASALYIWQIGTQSSQTNAKLVFSGSSGSRCTCNSVGNVAGGGFGINSTNWADAGRMEASYTDFSYQGQASTSGYFLQARLSTGKVSFDHCTIDHCAMIYNPSGALGAAATLSITFTKITNPTNTSFTVQTDGVTAVTTGTRLVTNNDWAGRFYILATGGTATGFTFKHNIIRAQDINASLPPESLIITGGGSVAAWDQNFLYFASNNSSTSDPSAQLGAGTYTNSLMFRLVNPSAANLHPIRTNNGGGDSMIPGWVHEYTGEDVNSDIIEPTASDAAFTLTVKNNIFRPNAVGKTMGSYLNNSSGFAQTNLKFKFEHNTCYGAGESGGNVFGVGCEAGSSWASAAVPSVQSNILWAATAASAAFLVHPASSGVTNSSTSVTTADYNDVFNITGSVYGGGSIYANTTGAHDLTANPMFVDSTRSLLSFDQGYLAQPVATAWANTTSYNVGDLVSTSVSTFFNSATYNYRCIAAHTSATATDKPGAGSAWVLKWEPAAVKSISDDILAGTTYSGGTNSLIGEAVGWIKAGFAPTNAALHNTAHDGTDIGAVAYLSPTITCDTNSVVLAPGHRTDSDGTTITITLPAAGDGSSYVQFSPAGSNIDLPTNGVSGSGISVTNDGSRGIRVTPSNAQTVTFTIAISGDTKGFDKVVTTNTFGWTNPSPIYAEVTPETLSVIEPFAYSDGNLVGDGTWVATKIGSTTIASNIVASHVATAGTVASAGDCGAQQPITYPKHGFTLGFDFNFLNAARQDSFLLILGSLTTSANLTFEFNEAAAGTATVSVATSGNGLTFTSTSFGNWHHYVVVFDGTTYEVFMDGTSQGTWTDSAMAPGTPVLHMEWNNNGADSTSGMFSIDNLYLHAPTATGGGSPSLSLGLGIHI